MQLFRRQPRASAPAGRRHRSRGQSLVEFALVLPILAVLLLGVLDAGRLFMSWITLNNEVRIAANYAASNPSAFKQTAYATLVNREGAGLNCDLQPAGGINPPAPTYPSGIGVGNPAVAAMSCKFDLWTPLMASLLGGPITLSSSAQFPIRTGAIENVTGSTTLPPPGTLQAAFSFVNVSGGTIDASGNVTGVGSVTVNVLDQSTNAQTYAWDFGDASNPDIPDIQYVEQPTQHVYGTPGTYIVTLTVTNTAGSSTVSSFATRSVTVTPKVAPVAKFYGDASGTDVSGGGPSYAPILGPKGLSVNFVNQSSGGSAYSWSFGDGSQPDTTYQPFLHTYDTYGAFTVTLTITAPTGGNPSSISQYVRTGCVVPTYSSKTTRGAASEWSAAGWTGEITYWDGSNKNPSKNAPDPAKPIVGQSLVGGAFYAAQDVTTGPNKGWQCANAIMLTYTP